MKLKHVNARTGKVRAGLVLLLLASLLTGCISLDEEFEPQDGGLNGETAPQAREPQPAAPTMTLPPQRPAQPANGEPASVPLAPPGQAGSLVDLYKQLNPGVVSIQVFIGSAGEGGASAGSGFILDESGHIVTNNHVVADATQLTVVFYDASEAQAEIVGTDDDSDLAIIRVDRLADGAHPLPLGDSDQVQVGEWVVAIGNPFGLSGSMTTGIVSALGRMIDSETPFSIPQAIQTDAAINPGNSGGPLLNLRGEVIGVNAQIATGGGVRANAGVGFAIPSNVVRLLAPSLIQNGAYDWPWLGIEGVSVSLPIAQANNLDTQQGAYIDGVVQGGPADRAGLRGSRGTRVVDGVEAPVGGDIVVAADGNPVRDFSALLVYVTYKQPGEQVVLTVMRGGQREEVTVTLAPRPQQFGP
jgi:2-alkenal reductase